MMETSRAEISAELLAAARRVAALEGRSEREVLDDAVRDYVVAFRVAKTNGAGNFRALLNRISSRFGDLDEDEAMEVALREQRSFRRERVEGGSAGDPS